MSNSRTGNILSPRETQSESSMATTSGYSSIAEEVEDYADSITRCICGFLHDDGFMVSCDKCLVWQHCVCMNLNKTNIPEEYYCERCSPRPIDAENAWMIQNRFAILLKNISTKTKESKSLPSNSNQTHVSQSIKMTKSIGSNKNHDIYAGSKGKLNSSSKRCLTTTTKMVSPVKPNASDTISNIGIPKKKISQDSSNSLSTNTRNESVPMTASNCPTNIQNDVMPTSQLKLHDSTNNGNESVPMTASKFPTNKQNDVIPTSQLELHDPSYKKGICTLCRLPEPPANIKNKVLNGLLSNVVISKASTYVAIDNKEATELPYRAREEALVFDSPWFYTATIINIHSDDQKRIWYNVHFDAYPDDDKCVTDDRIIRINEDSLKIKSKLDLLASLSRGSSQKDLTRVLDNGSTCYTKGRKVVVYFGGYLYNGQVMDLKTSNNADATLQYLIHYSGWNKMWDEWMTEERIFEPSTVCEEFRRKLQLFCNRGKLVDMQKSSDTVAIHEKCKKVGDKVGIVMKASTNLISCKCDRLYHKICTGIGDTQTSFCCADVGIKCLTRSKSKYQDDKYGKMIKENSEKSSKKLKRLSSSIGKASKSSKNTFEIKSKVSSNQVEKTSEAKNPQLHCVIGNFNESPRKCISAKVKNSKSMIVCCVCLKIVHSQEEMDTHWEKFHHISK